jgi:hypothetical protein
MKINQFKAELLGSGGSYERISREHGGDGLLKFRIQHSALCIPPLKRAL